MLLSVDVVGLLVDAKVSRECAKRFQFQYPVKSIWNAFANLMGFK